MNLYEQWKEQMEGQTDETFPAFWETYSGTEEKIYSDLLDRQIKGEAGPAGTVKELIDQYEVDPVIFMGFLDGIQGSLQGHKKSEEETAQYLTELKEDSYISLEVDFEKLYFNMLTANADYLYSLPQWHTLLGEDKIGEITKLYKKSKTVIKGKKIGRNEPCPCGSGKKYKHCCGRN